MIQLRYILLSSFLIICTVSCDFSEDNINEEAITEPSISELFEPAITQIAFNQSAISSWTTATVLQYFNQTDATILRWTNYNFTNVHMNQYWSDGLYLGSLRHANELQILGEKENNSDLLAIAQILKVNEYLCATTIFGDIPFSEALKGAKQAFPIYDTQESIYQELIAMSDNAIEMIGNNGVNSTLKDADIIFQGDMSSWKKFAFGLKARLHLHLTTKDPSNYNLVLSSVENSFTSIDDQANYTWNQHNGVQNPLYLLENNRPSLFNITDNFAFNMIDKSDPRMDFITSFDVGQNSWDYQVDDFPLHWSSISTTLPLLSYVELNFMKAEALLQTNANDSEVLDALRDGIEASCNQMGLSTSSYQDYLQNYASFDGLNSKKDKLEHIITEAYYAYYGFAFHQTWNNYKRLKIPELTPTGTPLEINPSGTVPVRYLYPQIELDLNPANTIEAIDRQNGALLDEPLWIFKQ